MVKLVNTADLKSAGASLAGSTPAPGTNQPTIGYAMALFDLVYFYLVLVGTHLMRQEREPITQFNVEKM